MGRLISKATRMEKEQFFIIMASYMKDSLKITKSKEQGLKYMLMGLSMLDSLKMIKEKAKGDFNGPMDKCMMDNGVIMLSMEVDYGRANLGMV